FYWKKDKDSERKHQMEVWHDQVDAWERLDALVRKVRRAKDRGQPFDWEDDAERHAYFALRFEELGDSLTAYEEWSNIQQLDQAGKLSDKKMLLVAKERLGKLEERQPILVQAGGRKIARAGRLELLQKKLAEIDKLEAENKILEGKAKQMRKDIALLYRHVQNDDFKKLFPKEKKSKKPTETTDKRSDQ